MRILIVDDEIKIREVVKEYARAYGYLCDEASDGIMAIELVKNNDYDCVILDIMMPRLDGFSACKQIRALKKVPIIILSARQEVDDKVFCFEMGADDYVTKPFSPKELMARIKAVCARNSNSVDVFVYEDLVVDINARSVRVGIDRINMTPKELDLLFYLIENKNMALSREQISLAVWKCDYFPEDRTVDTHIKMLRKSLGKYRDLIVTVRAVGYKLEV